MKTIKRLYTIEQLKEMSLTELNKALKKELQANFEGVKFSVKKVFGDPYVEYNADLKLEDVKAVAGWFNINYHDVRVNGNLTYYCDTPECKEEQRQEYKKQQEERQKIIDERNKLYNNNVTVNEIKNAKVINTEDKNIFITALEPSLNKNNWKIDNDKCINESSYLHKYKITDIVMLDEAEYNYFSFNLLEDFNFLNSKGGWEEDENGNCIYNYAVAVVSKGKEPLIIDPSGSSYARYTNKLIEDICGKLHKEININIIIDYKDFINKINSIDDVQLYKVNVRKETVIKDDRFILNDYTGITAVTGKALKELIFEYKGIAIKSIEEMKLKGSLEIFIDGIMKMETGRCVELFSNTRDSIKHIKFSQRLKNELQRARKAA